MDPETESEILLSWKFCSPGISGRTLDRVLNCLTWFLRAFNGNVCSMIVCNIHLRFPFLSATLISDFVWDIVMILLCCPSFACILQLLVCNHNALLEERCLVCTSYHNARVELAGVDIKINSSHHSREVDLCVRIL